MTIEERAQMCVDKIGILGAYPGYIIGANEQKAIDDKECESLVGLAVKEARRVFVEKACEWLDNTLPNIEYITNASALRQTKKQYIESFRKAMSNSPEIEEITHILFYKACEAYCTNCKQFSKDCYDYCQGMQGRSCQAFESFKASLEHFRKAMQSEGDRIEIPFVQVPESETAKLETSDTTNLTWQDMARIADIIGHTRRLTEEGFTRKPEEFYTEVLEKFKEK